MKNITPSEGIMINPYEEMFHRYYTENNKNNLCFMKNLFYIYHSNIKINKTKTPSYEIIIKAANHQEFSEIKTLVSFTPQEESSLKNFISEYTRENDISLKIWPDFFKKINITLKNENLPCWKQTLEDFSEDEQDLILKETQKIKNIQKDINLISQLFKINIAVEIKEDPSTQKRFFDHIYTTQNPKKEILEKFLITKYNNESLPKSYALSLYGIYNEEGKITLWNKKEHQTAHDIILFKKELRKYGCSIN